MDAPTAPETRPPLSRQQLKDQICRAIQALTKGQPPEAWHSWDAEKTSQFLAHLQGCHTGRSLAGLAFSAQQVVIAYGRNPAEILPAEAFK